MDKDIALAAYEYKSGDRVRILATEQKGNVLAVHANGLIEIHADDQTQPNFYQADQVEQVIPIYGSTGELERTRALQHISYAGTNLPEELIEIHRHLELMIEGGYPYLYMEKHLMSLGYGCNVIRKAFLNLTGITAQDAVNINYQFSPGNIPQFNLAWGIAKKGHGHYFVMPGVHWYSVFHQQSDMVRVEHGQYPTINDALKELGSLVKNVERWNPPVNELDLPKKHKPVIDTSALYKTPQLFMQAQQTMEWLSSPDVAPSQRIRLLNQAYLDGKIEQEVHATLQTVLADQEENVQRDVATDKLKDVEQKQISEPIENELSEKTPAQYFERRKLDQKYTTVPANVVDSVYQYIGQLDARLRDFDVVINSFKYSTLQPAATQPIPSEQPDIMTATANVSVLLSISDHKLQVPDNQKLALTVFSVLNAEIKTSDLIKGIDNQLYGLTDEGLAKYFQNEREVMKEQS